MYHWRMPIFFPDAASTQQKTTTNKNGNAITDNTVNTVLTISANISQTLRSRPADSRKVETKLCKFHGTATNCRRNLRRDLRYTRFTRFETCKRKRTSDAKSRRYVVNLKRNNSFNFCSTYDKLKNEKRLGLKRELCNGSDGNRRRRAEKNTVAAQQKNRRGH